VTASLALSSPLIVLASGSPRRQELLKSLGLSFHVVTPSLPSTSTPGRTSVDETPLPGETPAALVQRLSRLKAETVAAHLDWLAPSLSSYLTKTKGQIVIIAADTEVALGRRILGKPGNPAEAVAMLKQLRQQSHQVYSGLTAALLAADRTGRFVTRLHQSTVWMRPYTDAEIAAYVASGDPLDKAGAYGIQNQTFAPVLRLEGCFASVMGLPLGELAAAFQELGLSLPDIAPPCQQYTGYLCCQASQAGNNE
jgi:septum formation protein